MTGIVVPKPFFDIAAADMAYDLGCMPWEALYDSAIVPRESIIVVQGFGEGGC